MYLCKEGVFLLFGSEGMKEVLKEMMMSPTNFEKNFYIVYDVVWKYTINRVKKGFEGNESKNGRPTLSLNYISEEDCEDIASEVVISVMKSLDGFVLNIDRYDERSRQSWLKTIVYNKFAAFIKKRPKEETEKWDSTIETFKPDYTPSNSNALEVLFRDETLRLAVRCSCNAPSKPEKIICFLMNILVFREIAGRTQNNTSITTSKYVKGKKLFFLNHNFQRFVKSIYGIELDEDEVGTINKKLGYDTPTQLGECLCEATPKHITDWTNRMRDYLYLHKDEIIYGEEKNYDKK